MRSTFVVSYVVFLALRLTNISLHFANFGEAFTFPFMSAFAVWQEMSHLFDTLQ